MARTKKLTAVPLSRVVYWIVLSIACCWKISLRLIHERQKQFNDLKQTKAGDQGLGAGEVTVSWAQSYRLG